MLGTRVVKRWVPRRPRREKSNHANIEMALLWTRIVLLLLHFLAFSRGTATGGGTTRDSNQRLALAWQSFEWESSPEHNGKSESKGPESSGGGSAGGGVPLLDAAIVGEVVSAGVWMCVDMLMH